MIIKLKWSLIISLYVWTLWSRLAFLEISIMTDKMIMASGEHREKEITIIRRIPRLKESIKMSK